MENFIRWLKGDKETRRAAEVLLAICLQGALTYSCSVLSSSFYVTHLVNRGRCADLSKLITFIFAKFYFVILLATNLLVYSSAYKSSFYFLRYT